MLFHLAGHLFIWSISCLSSKSRQLFPSISISPLFRRIPYFFELYLDDKLYLYIDPMVHLAEPVLLCGPGLSPLFRRQEVGTSAGGLARLLSLGQVKALWKTIGKPWENGVFMGFYGV